MNFADWLTLREPADAAARAADLVDTLDLTGPVVVHDLGSGTGSMVRWLAPRLPREQRWILHERDTVLLEKADLPVPVEVRGGDLTRLTAADFAGASLITASALLDMFTADEVARVVDACAGARVPVLFTLSVIGRVELTPHDPGDETVQEAFNAHQRRTHDGRTLLGPDAAAAARTEFANRGIEVQTRSSPWRLGPDQAPLISEWFDGWIGAACEIAPELAAYADRRRGRITGAVVHHEDLCAKLP